MWYGSKTPASLWVYGVRCLPDSVKNREAYTMMEVSRNGVDLKVVLISLIPTRQWWIDAVIRLAPSATNHLLSQLVVAQSNFLTPSWLCCWAGVLTHPKRILSNCRDHPCVVSDNETVTSGTGFTLAHTYPGSNGARYIIISKTVLVTPTVICQSVDGPVRKG